MVSSAETIREALVVEYSGPGGVSGVIIVEAPEFVSAGGRNTWVRAAKGAGAVALLSKGGR